ncbi:hypothetical protein [Fimbriimonas ginsengisoli]|uniref:hypothetical protein n=1 Tax=Fimbriimonas ginsengisoli TaxID=1005039 RepID=UPI001185FB6D|nr:hypothetical protein [Fimbriimonas ginsengisoli]
MGFAWSGDAFVLARLADLRGLTDLANWFYAEAKNHLEWEPEGARGLSFENQVKFHFAESQIDRVKRKFADLSAPRSEILTDLEQFLARFPDSTYRQEAEGYARDLRPMVAEDAVRKPLTDVQLAQLAPATKAKELVWQLRNQTGHQQMEPGYVDVFAASFIEEETPAQKLVKLGFNAMPALIAGLDDRTLTRTVEGGMHNIRPKVLRIRDAAMQIIPKIANRRFDDGPGNWNASESALLNFKIQVKKWWSSFQTEGEEAVLVRSVSSGGSYSYEQAHRLVEAYPKSAFAAIKAGFAKSDRYGAPSLLRDLALLDTPESRAFLRYELLHGGSSEVRLAAAEGVQKFDSHAATEAMLGEWKKSAKMSESRELARFLATSYSPQVINSIAPNFQRISPELRMEFIESLNPILTSEDPEYKKHDKKELNEFETLCEALLVRELTDFDVVYGTSGLWGDFSFANPAIRELAAYTLHGYWPQKYAFRQSGSKHRQDALYVENINGWRKENGLPPLPLPARPSIVEASPSLLLPLFRRLPGNKAAEAKVIAIGLPALSPLVRHQKSLPILEAAKLEPLVVLMSNIVRTVHISGDPQAAKLWANKVRALTGKTLTAGRYGALLNEFIGFKPIQRRGVRFTVNRDDDSKGIEISVDFGFVDRSSSGSGVGYQESVQVGGNNIGGISGSSSGGSAIGYQLMRHFSQAFSAPYNVPFSISMAIERRL